MPKIKQISFTALVEENVDGYNFAEKIVDFLEKNGCEILGAVFEEDVEKEEVANKIYPCDNPDPYCPFDSQSGMDCRNFCGLGVDED